MTSFLQEFGDLVEASSDRRDFLSKLPAHLSPYEWRQVASILAARTFQVDILGKLPVELAALVFQHLSPPDCFAYQRVSRRWRAILSDPALQRICLARWVSPNDPPLAGESLVCSDQNIALRAKHALAFRRNQHHSSRLHVIPSRKLRQVRYLPDTSAMRERDFWQDLFAWVEETTELDDYVRIYNLRTGIVCDFRGQGRERLSAVVVTTELVACVTRSGICYARHNSSGIIDSIHLPSANVKAFAGRGKYVAMLCSHWPARSSSICLWDTQSGSTKSIAVEKLSVIDECNQIGRVSHDIIGIIIGENGDSLALIETSTSAREQTVGFRKYDMRGKILSAGNLSLKKAQYMTSIRSILPMNNDDQYICLFRNSCGSYDGDAPYATISAVPQQERSHTTPWTTIMFDYKRDRLVPFRSRKREGEFSSVGAMWKEKPLGSWVGEAAFRLRLLILLSGSALRARLHRGQREVPNFVRSFGNDRMTLDIKALDYPAAGDVVAFYVRSFDKDVELPREPEDLEVLSAEDDGLPLNTPTPPR